jgi:hypothetical protein
MTLGSWLLLVLLLLVQGRPGWAEAAIYVGGPLYSGGPGVIQDLDGSGFRTVVAWTLHVTAGGDLRFNDEALVTAGRYVGDPAWPGRLASLKGPGNVRQLLFSVGSAEVQDFHHIQTLIGRQGTGPGSILNRAFSALKAAIPVTDGIDLDDEDLLDPATTVAFSRMLGGLGLRVSFCAFGDPQFWINCLAVLESQAPGLVGALRLQCYAGGAGNDPAAWIRQVQARMGPEFDAQGWVQPGRWCRHGRGCRLGNDPDAMEAQFHAWKPAGIRHGFLWLYDDLLACYDHGRAADYAAAIRQGLLD